LLLTAEEFLAFR